MKKRVLYLDYLRVMATFAVVFLHVAAQNWNSVSGRSLEWNIFNICDGIARWAVPIFIMISGSLFLSRETPTKEIYTKYILRLVVAYFFWAVFYAFALPTLTYLRTGHFEMSVASLISNIITGAGHMWFLPLIIGLYMCIPITRQIVASQTVTKYFLWLSLMFAFLLPALVNISNDFIGGWFASIINQVNNVITGNMRMNLVLGYTAYFILGHYLNQITLTPKQRILIYVLGAVGFLFTFGFNAIIAWRTNTPCEKYFFNFNPSVLLEAVSIHTLFKYSNYPRAQCNRIVSVLSKYSFGAYLVHIFVLRALQAVGLNTLTFCPVISVPAISLAVIPISFALSWLISKIPMVSRWIV